MRSLPLLALFALVWVALAQPAQAKGGAEDSALRQSLYDFFAAGVTVDGATASLVSVSNWPDHAGALRWSLPPLHGHPRYFSLIAEQVARGHGARRGGARARRWYVRVEVQWWARVAVAKSDIPARAMLNPSMVTMRRVDIAGRNGSGFSSPAAVDGLRLLRRARKGEPIYVAMTHRMPMIKRGQLVTIEARYGAVQVTTAGKALRSARRGELVLVENLRSKRQVQGTVVNAHTVRVAFGGGAG